MFYLFLIPAGYLLMRIAATDPQITEFLYSDFLYKAIATALNQVSTLFPFSLGEVLLFSFLILLVIIFLYYLFKGRFLKALLSISQLLSILYIAFVLLWGLNYSRLSFGEISGLNIEKSEVTELENLCKALVNEANTLSQEYGKSSEQMSEKELYKNVFANANKGFIAIEDQYDFIKSKYLSPPKPIFVSEYLNYTGITGIYSPFTGEANVNVATPYIMLPVTTCHEMAHQRGFAREDEANFIGYLACMNQDDVEFKYSATILALIHSTNALYTYDKDAYYRLVSTYSEDVQNDLTFWNKFWDQYEGKIEEISSKINDSYLKTNLQSDGTHSYGRMVDLLIAYYRQK